MSENTIIVVIGIALLWWMFREPDPVVVVPQTTFTVTPNGIEVSGGF